MLGWRERGECLTSLNENFRNLYLLLPFPKVPSHLQDFVTSDCFFHHCFHPAQKRLPRNKGHFRFKSLPSSKEQYKNKKNMRKDYFVSLKKRTGKEDKLIS